MKASLNATVGWVLAIGGLLVIVLSNKIVFPGLERLVGIENIVGGQNVVYQADGSYLYTNPGAMAAWTLSVAAVGALGLLLGIWLIVRSRRGKVGRVTSDADT